MRTLPALALLAAAVSIAACEGENLFKKGGAGVIGGDPEPVPVYEATRFEFENQAGEIVDLIDEGALFELTLDEDDGTFDSSFRYRAIDFDVTGTFDIELGTFTFSDDPFSADEIVTPRSFAFFADEGILIFREPEAVFDIDNDGTAEVGSLEIRLEEMD